MERLQALVLLVFFAAACAPERAEPESLGVQRSPIVKGIASDALQDSTVLVMHYDALVKGGGAASGCTGSLLTPRLVLTARHCVSVTDSGAACTAQGKPVSGGAVTGDHQPSAIYVFGGKDRPDFLSGTARPAKGAEILTTGAKTLCNNDIALVLLDRPLEGAKITPIRLDATAAKDEVVTVVGWGITEDQPNPPTRRQRTGLRVLAVGPRDDLGPAEFRVDEGNCQGDSGGPAIAPSGAVLGALSRGGNDAGDKGASGCLGATNIFTSIAGHADFIRAGYAKAGQEPWLEGGTNPLLATLGGTCGSDGDCRSNVCDVDAKACSQDCAQAVCPSGFVCASKAQGKRLCVVAPEDEGCAIRAARSATDEASSATPILFALAVLFGSRWRKK